MRSSSASRTSSRSAPRPARLARCSVSRGVSRGQRFLLGLGPRPAGSLLGEIGNRPRRLPGIESRIEVDRARQLDEAIPALPGVGVEQALGAVEPAGGHARERVQRLALEPSRGEEGLDRPLRKPAEGDELAPRPDRRRQQAELVGDQDDHRVRRRLLEILEERVGCVLVHEVRPQDEVNAPLRLEGPHVQVAAKVADRVDPDLVAERLEHVEIRMDTATDPVRVSKELGRESECRTPLAHAPGTVEEVGVRGPLDERGAEEALGLVLLREGLEAVHGRSRRYLRG